MTRVAVSRQAEIDLDDITDYISRENPERGVSFAYELQARFNDIAERPLSFTPRAEWGDGKRSATHGRYVIIFHTFENFVEILRVVHGARDIDGMFE